ncbi:MAG: HAD family hydrolase, partial [Oscillospiraceae bacterium]|nr:HAD family hydrolase [Oscillospiraceae bacterium]
MRYQLAIFDLDGTILDTLEDLYLSVNHALQENNMPKRTIQEVRQFVGNGIRKLIERAVPSGTDTVTVDRVHADFTLYYKVHYADCTAPYAGITDILSALRNAGIQTAVVSNKADYAVQALCAQYFPSLFDTVAGEKEGVRRKPAPDAVYAVLETLAVPKEKTVYIGDSDVDIQTAQNAGIPCISVDWG